MPQIKDPDQFINGVMDDSAGQGFSAEEPQYPVAPPTVEGVSGSTQAPVVDESAFDDTSLGSLPDGTNPETTEYGMSEEKLEEIRQNVLKEINRADNYYEEEIEPDIIRRHKVFEGDKDYYQKKFPKLSKISDVTASDFQDTVEWAIPSLVKVFFGSEDICKLQGVNSEKDEQAAKTNSELIKYQLERINDGFLIFYDWIKNALIDNIGFLKCYWEREATVEAKQLVVTEEQLMQMQTNPKINVLSVEKIAQGIINVEYEETTNIIKNQPKLEVIPPSEFRFSPQAKSLDDIDFVAHRKVVTLDYLRRREKEGIFQNIDKVLEEDGEGGSINRTMYETDLNPRAYDKINDNETEDAKKEFLLYECYVKTDVNNDGILEDIIITIVEQTVVRLEENTMGRHPFFAISPIRDTLRLFPKRGIADLVGEIQDLNTALLKQIINNIAINNDKQAFINTDLLVDPSEFIDGRKAVRVTGDPSQAVKWSPIEPLPPQVFNLLEELQSLKENRTGITKYNQGMDASSLNKTATGITQIMNASNQRLELIARMFAETGVKQLFRHMIKMNQMFITDETFIRVTDDRKPIYPDDLEGTIDITVNVGIAAGTKQQQYQNLQLLLNMYPQVIQAGVADISHVAFAFDRLIETMGYKNVSDFAYTPTLIKQAQMQGVSPQMMSMLKLQQESGQPVPAVQKAQQQQAQQAMMQVAQQRGLLQNGGNPSNEEQQFQMQKQQDNANLSTQQFAQRNAPQPRASDENRRTLQGE